MKCEVKLLVSCCMTFALLSGLTASIDPLNEIGYCKRLALPPDSSLIYANEGVWFPQYRTRTQKSEHFSCHTLYEGLSRDQEDGSLALKQISYFTARGEANINPKTTLLDKTLQKGVYVAEEFLSGFTMSAIYHIILKVTPDIRLRYVCTNTTSDVRHDFDLVYIETRRAVGLSSDIKPAVKVLHKAGLRATLVKIKQDHCKRPLSSMGYDESLFFEES